VLAQADSDAELLAKIEGTVGPIPGRLVNEGQHSHSFYTRSRQLYRAVPAQAEGAPGLAERLELLKPNKAGIQVRAPGGDEAFYDFVRRLLSVDPAQRPTAAEALAHPWLQHKYDGVV
jgi:serine/threonine protein kinase